MSLPFVNLRVKISPPPPRRTLQHYGADVTAAQTLLVGFMLNHHVCGVLGLLFAGVTMNMSVLFLFAAGDDANN